MCCPFFIPVLQGPLSRWITNPLLFLICFSTERAKQVCFPITSTEGAAGLKSPPDHIPVSCRHLSREASGKSEGRRRDEEHLCRTHQIPHSGWMFSLSFIWSIIYNIESELIWFQLDYWSSALQQCFLCCTLARMWVSRAFLLQLSWWRPLPSPQTLRGDDQAAGSTCRRIMHGACRDHSDILKKRVSNAWGDVLHRCLWQENQHVYNNSTALWLREGNLTVQRPLNTEGVKVV